MPSNWHSTPHRLDFWIQDRYSRSAMLDPKGAIAMTPALPMEQPEAHEEEPRRPMWELAECTCPDFCERDHELD